MGLLTEGIAIRTLLLAAAGVGITAPAAMLTMTSARDLTNPAGSPSH
ncbi:MAG TPA: hypothetical protein VII01_15755 [Solirubrobacteraceae bacterium]